MNNRTLYCFVSLLAFRATVLSQILVAIPDTSAYRGATLALPISIDAIVQRDDTIKITLYYSRSALHIEQILPEFPSAFHVLRLLDDRLSNADTGQATIEAIPAETLTQMELKIVCAVLWSGSSPAFLKVGNLEINNTPLLLNSRSSRILLLPDQALPIKEKPALGPLSPQPLYDRHLSITYWLAEQGSPTFILYDPIGREYGRWHLPSQSAGPHTFEIELDRMATAAGIYYLRMQVGQHTLIAPCVIGK